MMLRSGAVWFFTPSNPRLTFGGMDGEPKREMYDLLPPHMYPATFNVLPSQDFDAILLRIQQQNIPFPLIVKPEVGCAGVLFRKIDEPKDLLHYHKIMPVEYIVQQLVTFPMEVSVFYVRHPLQEKGKVTGFLYKIPMQVVGDGEHTLEQLIQAHPKANKRQGELHSKHRHNWDVILPAGQKYMLSHAANHNRGAHFVDLKDEIDDRLLSMFDQISHELNDFFYGRYDILCASVEDLKQGKNYSILEFNGCGAEPNHIYDTGYTLKNAYREILKHWKDLYEISRYNRLQGVKPWPFLKGLRFRLSTHRHYRILKRADRAVG